MAATLTPPTGPRPNFTELGAWVDEAACRDANPEWFVWDGTPNVSNLHRAVTLCASCPVRAQCSADADENKSVGLWGGILRGTRAKPTDLLARVHDTAYWSEWRREAGRFRGAL